MGAIATFDYPKWLAAFPEFNGSVTEELANIYWQTAVIAHANDGTGLVQDQDQQLSLLNLVVAHIAKLFAPVNGVYPSGIPGRISNASEGSVSVGYDLGNLPQAATWWAQTSYGFLYWQLTAPYRTARYLPGPRRQFGPLYAGGYPRRGWW